MRPVYEKYKPSNIPWIKEIPMEWKVYPFFAAAEVNKLKNISNAETNLLSLSYGKIIRKDINSTFGLLPESFETYQIVDAGHIVFRLTDLQNDKVSLRSALVRERGIITSAYLAVKFSSLDPKYADYLMRSYDKSTVFYELGGGVRQSAKYDDLKWMPILIPPMPEQKAIVAFLDKKTTAIDDLIAKKKKLLKLLAEKHAAIITNAVTKGLDAKAAMKPSGIDWLGDVPEAWKITPLRYLGQLQNGISFSSEKYGYGSPFVSYGDVYKNFELPKNVKGQLKTSQKDQKSYSVNRGDVFFTRTSETIEEIAISSVCISSIIDATFAGFLIRFRPYKNKLHPNFSKFYFRNQDTRKYFVKEMNLVTRASLNQDLLGGLSVLLPPYSEQKDIGEFLNIQCSKIDQVIKSTSQSIDKYKEYRTSLITNAVTGKIKVI